jgi:hypothetical protein
MRCPFRGENDTIGVALNKAGVREPLIQWIEEEI